MIYVLLNCTVDMVIILSCITYEKIRYLLSRSNILVPVQGGHSEASINQLKVSLNSNLKMENIHVCDMLFISIVPSSISW